MDERTVHDRTDRKSWQEQFKQQIYREALTGVPNRFLARVKRKQTQVAVCYMDLGHF